MVWKHKFCLHENIVHNVICKVWYILLRYPWGNKKKSMEQDIIHYCDVIMDAIASQITSLTIVYSIVYSDADQRKHQSSASLAFVREFTGDRWILRTNGQLRGKCFNLMTSSWNSWKIMFPVLCMTTNPHHYGMPKRKKQDIKNQNDSFKPRKYLLNQENDIS